MKSGNLELLVAAASAGRSLAEIAAAAGVSISTVQRRLRDRDVVQAINDLRTQQRSAAVGQLSELRSEAIAELKAMIHHDNPQVSVRAIALVLRTSATFDIVHDLDLRVSALESPPPEEETDESERQLKQDAAGASDDG
jgi:AcrR family transcriptional regulator